MLVPLLVGILYGEWYSALAFLVSGVITAGAGGVLYVSFRAAPEPKQHHSMIVAGAGWFVIALFGALPFVLAAYWTPSSVVESYGVAGTAYRSSLLNFTDPLHALFESMSGYTTTGLTMSVHEPSVGHAFLWYRSQMQWLGGAGVIVLSLAILQPPGGGSGFSLYQSEGREERLRPSVISTARVIWKIYLGLTLGLAVYLAVVTFLIMPEYGLEATLFDAINHAMTGQSTGGFSTLDESLAGYESYAMEVAYVPAMISGAISIPVYYVAIFERQPREFLDDVQVRTMLKLFAVGVIALSTLLALSTHALSGYEGDFAAYLWELLRSAAFREGLFQYVSALSTTGWQTASIGDWGDAAILFIVFFAMISGGAAGATVGGVKILRVLLITRGIRWEVTRTFLPEHAVEDVQLGTESFTPDEFDTELRNATLLVFAYLLLAAIALVLLVAMVGEEFTLADAIFEIVTAMSTVGLSTGIAGPDMPVAAEIMLILLMWIGRLEIIPVLVFLKAISAGIRG